MSKLGSGIDTAWLKACSCDSGLNISPYMHNVSQLFNSPGKQVSACMTFCTPRNFEVCMVPCKHIVHRALADTMGHPCAARRQESNRLPGGIHQGGVLEVLRRTSRRGRAHSACFRLHFTHVDVLNIVLSGCERHSTLLFVGCRPQCDESSGQSLSRAADMVSSFLEVRVPLQSLITRS